MIFWPRFSHSCGDHRPHCGHLPESFLLFPLSHIKVESHRRSFYRDRPHTQRITLPTSWLSSYHFPFMFGIRLVFNIFPDVSNPWFTIGCSFNGPNITIEHAGSKLNYFYNIPGCFFVLWWLGGLSLPQECFSWRPVLPMHLRTSFFFLGSGVKLIFLNCWVSFSK